MSSAGQIASIICKNFAQNAWKKDLCSNCFKSEVEHQDSALNNGSSQIAQVNSSTNSNHSSEQQPKDIKWKISTTHPNLLSQTNGNQSSIKPLNISINQTNGNKTIKSVNDCQNTTTTILQSSKKSVNICGTPSPQILLNTKKINSTHVLSPNISENCVKVSDKPSKDNIKDNNLNNNSINNCLELRKVINSKLLKCEENNVIIINNNNNVTKDPKEHNFPQLSTTKDKLILSQTNVKNNTSHLNNVSNNNCLTETTVSQVLNTNKKMTLTHNTLTTKAVPLVGILKTESTRGLIKYRSKNKCLVFKEGDPMIIGYGIDTPIDGYGSGEEYSDEEPEVEEPDDFDDDEQIYYSDDKELRELTRVNTMYNSNFANFSINKLNENNDKPSATTAPTVESEVVSNDDDCAQTNANDSSVGPKENSVVVSEPNGCVTEVSIPEVCEKLVENSLVETFEQINDTNSGINCESIKSLSPDSSNSDTLPMSTSSDSYSSSSSDEKEDSLHSEEKTPDIENFKTHLIVTQNGKPVLESKHLRTDSESDNSSTNSDSGLEIQDYKRKPQEPIKPQIPKNKPQLPVKPNISTILMNSTTICVESPPKATHFSVPESEPKSSEDEEEDDKSEPDLLADQIYEEICESNEEMIGTEGKFSMKSDEILITNEKVQLEVKSVNEAKRDIKLAELAQELEQVRHMKRPAPQPPFHKHITPEIAMKEEIVQVVKYIPEKQSINITSNISDQKLAVYSSTSNTSNSTLPTKPHRFSIRKLLHKKSSSDKSPSTKTRDHSNESQHSNNSNDFPGADRKAWKQSEFDRTNLKIVHPIDLTESNDITRVVIVSDAGRQTPDQKPEAPPRTPKPSRPSVPARRRKQSSNPHLLQPRGEPPPPPPPTTPPPPLSTIPPIPALTVQAVEPSVKANDLNEAYNQLAKSNYSNLLAIKFKVESIYKEVDYKWCDFEVAHAVRLGSALLYKDSIVSKTGKSVNLLVLPDCYCSPIVSQFRHHSDLVLVLEPQWTRYHLLSELSVELEPKLLNSLILQLYLILENLEKNDCNHLPNDIIDKIIICTTKEDCQLIVPFDRPETGAAVKRLTLHQFLAKVLEKLLRNSLFGCFDLQLLSQPSISISHSKTIVQLIIFQIPVHQMNDTESGVQQINYWFDINRSKFINQFCCLSVDTTKLLTHLDYNYLNFLCNDSIDLIRSSIALLVNTTNNTKNC